MTIQTLPQSTGQVLGVMCRVVWTSNAERPQVNYKIPLILEPQPEGGFTVTSPLLPELVTEGDSVEGAMANVKDALAAVVESYQDLGRSLPKNAQIQDASEAVWFETVITAP